MGLPGGARVGIPMTMRSGRTFRVVVPSGTAMRASAAAPDSLGRNHRAARRPPLRADESLMQLATRIPRELQLRLKVHCVESETTLTDFTRSAILELLERAEGRRR